MLTIAWYAYPETRMLISVVAALCAALQLMAWWELIPRRSVRRRQLEIRRAGLAARRIDYYPPPENLQ